MTHIDKNISSILQQYEFAMAIGNHLDFNKNCDQFLKLFLAKKNLSNCWIIQESDANSGVYNIRYSYPNYNKNTTLLNNKTIASCFEHQATSFYINIDNDEILPISLKKGAVLFLKLNNHGGLFLHDFEKTEFSTIEINQILPIIDKFSLSLTACESFAKKEGLLKKLKKQNRELQDYAQAVSHDLKSPLRNINTLISWIKEENNTLEEETAHNLHLIDKNIEKMDAVISGIIEYSLIDTKEMFVKPIHIHKVIKCVIDELAPPAHVKFVIEDNLPILQSDRCRIQLLFSNLISNAIKGIGHKDGIITLGAKEQQDHWCFYVKDTGKGISKRYHEKIFQIFQTLDDTKESTGVGLSIVKKIVDLHEGEIWIESEEELGANFYFTLKK